MLELRNVCKSYGNFHAVKDVGFTVNRGEIVGLLGPNGAGKTTIMRILTGYHYPGSGTVNVDGLDLFSDTEEIKNKIGYLPENAPLYPELTVAECLGFQAEVRIPEKERRSSAISTVVERCGLEQVYNRPVDELSKGFRQRVGLAQSILHDPEILILDEPTTGLDPNQIHDIRSLIRDLGTEKTIILSTHIMQEVEAVCSRILIINGGELAAQGSTHTIGRELRGDDCYYLRFGEISDDALGKLEGEEKVSSVNPSEDGYEIFLSGSDNQDFIFSWCVDNSVTLRELTPRSLSLEDIFAALTRSKEAE